MSKFNQIKYVNEYNISHYDRINLLTPRGLKSKIKAHAAARGESVNAFIARAAAAQIERDRAEDERRAAEADNPEAVTPPTVTTSEPETAGTEQNRPTSDGKQTAAEAPEDSTSRTDDSPTKISAAPTDSKPGNTTEPEQDGRTTTAPKPRRGRPPKQADRDPAQLTLDGNTTDSGSDRG